MTVSRDELRDARKAAGLTALEVAESIGVREHAVYATERGRRTPSREEAIGWALALHTPAERLFPELFSEGGER